jgi:GAF domain-containing protein
MDLPEEIVAELHALAGVALAHDDLGEALSEVCRIATRSVGGADGATLTTFDASGPQAVAASSEWAKELDEMQYAEHEGPCLDAARSGMIFRVRDIATEVRWPSYIPRAQEAGAMSMVSMPMTIEAKTIGALDVYSRKSNAFDAEDVSLAEIITGHASLATQVAASLHGHRDMAEQLQTAMASRATIEQAKGIIMGAVGCGPDTAFERLVQQSQHENRKLREIAEELVRRQDRGSS